MLGYLPAYLARDAAYLLHSCYLFDVFVERVNPPPAGVHHRLLLRVEACWPDEFIPYSSEEYFPLAAKATNLKEWISPRLVTCRPSSSSQEVGSIAATERNS